MNKAFLIGNLTRDPEGGVTSNGVSYCRFGLAVQRRFANQNGEREVDFFNIVVWRGLADNCLKYLKKGAKAAISGQIQISTYEKDGVNRQSFEIVAEDVEFLTPKSQQEGESYAPSGGYTAPQAKQVQAKTSISDMKPVESDTLPF